MSLAITEEQRALQESIKAWSGGFGTAPVRAREPADGTAVDGADTARQWSGLADLGVLAVALSEEVGGGGGTVADLSAGLEQAADALVVGPVLPTALAGLLLDRRRDQPEPRKLLTGIAEGSASVAVADGSGDLTLRDSGDGRWVVSGHADHVVCAGETTHLLLCAGGGERARWLVVEADRPGIEIHGRSPMDFSRRFGRVVLHEVAVSPGAEVPGLSASEVADLAITLAAAEACGIAAWCLRTAVEYARTREQFGQVIGSFQAVQQMCARMACRVEQASALAWDAARAADGAPEELPLAAAVAGALALDAAVEVAKDCVQVLGGIGFTWEHDAHLYLRRAMALRQTSGGSAPWRRRAAELALAGDRRTPRVPDDLLALAEPRRPEIRRTLDEVARAPEDQRRIRLADTGLLAPHWPAPYGMDASPALDLVIEEELERAGLRRPDLGIAAWAVPTLIAHGTDEQRDRLVGPTLRGEVTWCQLFSEPEAGSDLASLRTRAVRVDGGWRLTGQKVWTSLARQADRAICLARTDPDAPKHRGITYFLVDMRGPGLDIRPLREMTGETMFNEVFLHDVFVPDADVVGEPGTGWRVARATLANERVALSGSSLGAGVERAIGLVRGRSEPGVLERLGGHVAESMSVASLGARSTLRRLNGTPPGPESSVEKLLGVWHRQDVAEFVVDLLGADGATVDGTAGDPAHEFLVSRCLSIAGGTTQVLLTLVAERLLGLPRA